TSAPAPLATGLARRCLALGVPGPRLFRFLPVASGCRIILHTLVPVQMGFETGRLQRKGKHLVPGSSNSCSAVAHGAPARSEACRWYLLPRRPGSCAGCAETLAG